MKEKISQREQHLKPLRKEGVWGFEELGKTSGPLARNRKTQVGKEVAELGKAPIMQAWLVLLRIWDFIQGQWEASEMLPVGEKITFTFRKVTQGGREVRKCRELSSYTTTITRGQVKDHGGLRLMGMEINTPVQI